MKLTAAFAFQFAALLSAAHSSGATLRGTTPVVGAGDGKRKGKGEGRTLVVQLRKEKGKGGASPAARCREVARAAHARVTRVYSHALHGCALEVVKGGTKAAAASLAAAAGHAGVTAVEEDGVARATYSWGLDRVDQCQLPLEGPDTPLGKVDAEDVRVYVLDTGIDKEHSEFDIDGMMSANCHADKSSGGTGAFDDQDGHGTHVAGTVCGKEYGVATCGSLCAVKVLDNDGTGLWSSIIAGVDHVVADCEGAYPSLAGRKCVINMSLGGGLSPSLNAAVRSAADAGVVVVVAAGNEEADACGSSPASEPQAITVGATNILDQDSWFSNFGRCVDVYAPGSDIVSAAANTGSGTIALDGTSMASPHVAGIAAGMLGEGGLAAGVVADRLLDGAQLLADRAPDGSDLWLANTVGGCGGSRAPTPAPTPCTASSVTVAVRTDMYPGETSWDLVNLCGGGGGAGRDDYFAPLTDHEDTYCLPAARYRFTMRDSVGDGLCCSYGSGGYTVSLNGVVTKESDGEFGFEEAHELGTCGPTSSPAPSPTPPLPSKEPTISPTVTLSPTSLAPAPTPCTASSVTVAVRTDRYPVETSWDLEDLCGGGVSAGRDNYFASLTDHEDTYCLPVAQYRFTMRDSFGDGLCCSYGSGGYTVSLNGVVTKESDGEFGFEEAHDFGTCAIPIPPGPTEEPTLFPTSHFPTFLPTVETPSPTSLATAPVLCTAFRVTVAVATDDYPWETSWDLADLCNGKDGPHRADYNAPLTDHEDTYCLPASRWRFTMRDSAGDGLCCGYGRGSYQVSLNGVVTKESEWQFGHEEAHELGSCVTEDPSASPSVVPSVLTEDPSASPSVVPSVLTENPSASPSVGPSVLPAEDPVTNAKYYVVCGKGSGCGEGDMLEANVTEEHAVRCCSDALTHPGAGWGKRSNCDVWSLSRVDGLCHRQTPFDMAVGHCAGIGARLCSREELSGQCTKGSGCGIDNHLVWSSSPVAVAAAVPNYYVVCGKGSGCLEGDADVAPGHDLHEVRCCSDESLPGWTKQAGCDIWAESEFNGTCHHGKSHDEAQDICAGAGTSARLCTKAELQAQCTKGTGCGHDADLIWSDTAE